MTIWISTAVLVSGCVEFDENLPNLEERPDLMQKFVIDIAEYAREINPDFIIIPQNGVELAFNEIKPKNGINTDYIDAIDGIGIEELFYNGNLNPVDDRNDMLDKLSRIKTQSAKPITIMVSDYINSNSYLANAFDYSSNNDFICFPRIRDNRYYDSIPPGTWDYPVGFFNDSDITELKDAKNYLYLISNNNYRPRSSMLNAIKETDYDVILIDMFYDGLAFTPFEVEALKTKANGGKRLVISYINIGSAETYRYYWNSSWRIGSPSWIRKTYSKEYSDEYYVKFWDPAWQNIIYGNDGSYIKKIINAGFDGAYLDNVEAYYYISHDYDD